MRYVFGNWKSNKNYSETLSWVEEFKKHNLNLLEGIVEVVICPPFPFIPTLKNAFKDTPWIKVGSQDISFFGAGTYTGEVSGHTLADLVDYAIIGHSERKRNLHETDSTTDQKAQNALEAGITPLVLVRNAKDQIPNNVKFVCYEPEEAISKGTFDIGHNIDPQFVVEQKQLLPLPHDVKYIYGGSVSPENIRAYAQTTEIDGVLPGSASLDPNKLFEIAKAYDEHSL